MGQAATRCGLSHQSRKNDCVLLDRRRAYSQGLPAVPSPGGDLLGR